ncbi:MAG TPA: three-Cys-motif partner protein TcmP [Gaiellaceae bacterium]|nr:three-Cys-motif partner protein TcmP [Gaiellaceae bacterium]
MVALRRPDELPPPPDDGLPARPIRDYALDKIHYWGNFLEAASTATKRAFPGTRVCADLFCASGVGENKVNGARSWGTALVGLQVAVPFDVYFFNDLNPDAARATATRAREIGVQGASVFELDLRKENGLSRARDIAKVVVPFGPKVVVATGDANTAHVALKLIAPQGRRYICAVIDPESALYEWSALEALAFHEKAMDVLLLFPDEIDLGRGLAYYLREGGGAKLDRYFPPGTDWRSVAKASPHPASALRRLYEERMETLLGFKIGHAKTVSMGNRALYRLVFGSRDQLGIKIWNDICKRTRGEQYELPFLDV